MGVINVNGSNLINDKPFGFLTVVMLEGCLVGKVARISRKVVNQCM